jgi:hypothetical protein
MTRNGGFGPQPASASDPQMMSFDKVLDAIPPI